MVQFLIYFGTIFNSLSLSLSADAKLSREFMYPGLFPANEFFQPVISYLPIPAIVNCSLFISDYFPTGFT